MQNDNIKETLEEYSGMFNEQYTKCLPDYEEDIYKFLEIIKDNYIIKICTNCNNPDFKIVNINNDGSGIKLECTFCNTTSYSEINNVDEEFLIKVINLYKEIINIEYYFYDVKEISMRAISYIKSIDYPDQGKDLASWENTFEDDCLGEAKKDLIISV